MVKEKARILRWRGVLCETNRSLRYLIASLLVVAGAALTFTQLGFVDTTLHSGGVAYIISLLQVVALAALLLGTLEGAVVGLIIGAALCLHARWVPLDYFELSFVTPFTSVVLLGLVGLLLGILFAFALRKDPPQLRRIIHISIVCIVVSWFYSMAFAFNAVSLIAASILEQAETTAGDGRTLQTAWLILKQLGGLNMQVCLDAVFMAVVCCVGDFTARKVQKVKGSLGLRTVFGTRLSVVVLFAFMVVAATSFTAISINERNDAEKDLRDEVSYICGQYEAFDTRTQIVLDVVTSIDENVDLDDAVIDDLEQLSTDEYILNGYTVEQDGLIVAIVRNKTFFKDDSFHVYASNDESLEFGKTVEEAFGSELSSAIEQSVVSNRMERFAYNEAIRANGSATDWETGTTNSHIAYVYAKPVSQSSSSSSDDDMIVLMVQTSDQVFSNRSENMLWTTVSFLVLLLSVYAIIFRLLDRVIARRIDEENGALLRITAGDLSVRAEASGTREFDSLSEGINTTVDALKGWIAEAESRMDAELATAKAIQESALPRIFPPYPDNLKFDIHASMNAARQVGGDFYDFFLIGDDCDNVKGKLGFVVADVSGKGVPAALFMMKAKAQIRGYVGSRLELGEAITEANRQLCEGNDEGMFVTAWVGVLDYGTGHIDYVNAGHNPPLIWQRESGWRWIQQRSGPMLGLFDRSYQAHSLDCTAGDTLLLYTDGVTEALDVNENLYGRDRLLEVLDIGYRLHPRELLEAVQRDLASYTLDAEQSDDITMLALEVGVPPEITAILTVPAQLAQLERVNSFLHAELDCRLCPQRTQNQLDIAIEELFVNVCNYAYPEATSDKPGTVRIQRTYSAEPPSITVDIIDEGEPFDPLAKPDAVTPNNIEDVPIGGLGILMAKKSVDEMFYERADNCNIVTIVKSW